MFSRSIGSVIQTLLLHGVLVKQLSIKKPQFVAFAGFQV